MSRSIAVAEPESFPNPIIRKSSIRKVNIVLPNGSVLEKRTIIDSTFGRQYELGAQLKKAIFGQVMHAILLRPLGGDNFARTDSEVAIKVYSKKTLRALQGKTQENPLMEITALQFISDAHPNIMGQIECCTDDDNIYSIMRFIKGGELFDFIDESGPMQESQAKSMFRQLINGLLRLQELGIGHRDMSLENILYDGRDLYVIIDFGMCIRLKRNPASLNSPVMDQYSYCSVVKQSICGKKNYISPEVLRGDETFNPLLCDVWAAGMLTVTLCVIILIVCTRNNFVHCSDGSPSRGQGHSR